MVTKFFNFSAWLSNSLTTEHGGLGKGICQIMKKNMLIMKKHMLIMKKNMSIMKKNMSNYEGEYVNI